MNPEQPRYVWPRYVLAALVLGVVLAIVWMSVLVRRTREQRDNMWPPARPPIPQTNAAPAKTNAALVKTQRMAELRNPLSGGNAEASR